MPRHLLQDACLFVLSRGFGRAWRARNSLGLRALRALVRVSWFNAPEGLEGLKEFEGFTGFKGFKGFEGFKGFKGLRS